MDTQAGWLEKQEVVEVLYDSERTTIETLVLHAKGIRRFAKAWFADDKDLVAAKKLIGDKAVPMAGKVRRAKEVDQLYFLGHSPIQALGLEGTQAIRVNALLALKKDVTGILSPRQQARWLEIQEAAKKGKKANKGQKGKKPDAAPHKASRPADVGQGKE